MNEFYKTRDVMKRLGVSRWTLIRMVKNGGFPRPMEFNKRSRRWPIAEIDAWLQGRAMERVA